MAGTRKIGAILVALLSATAVSRGRTDAGYAVLARSNALHTQWMVQA
jgi:hypothetical protein